MMVQVIGMLSLILQDQIILEYDGYSLMQE